MPHLTLCAPRSVAAAAAILIASLPLLARAQGPAGMGAPPSAQQMAARAAEARKAFYKQLELTPPQITKFEGIQKKYNALGQKRMGEMRKKYGDPMKMTPEQRQKAVQEITPFVLKTQADSEKDLMAILTPAQQKKFQDMKTKKMRPGAAPPR